MFKKARLTRKEWRKNRGVVVIILIETMVVFSGSSEATGQGY